MNRSLLLGFVWAFCSLGLAGLACSASPPPAPKAAPAGNEAAPAASASAARPAWPEGLVPCAKDAPEGTGCATKPAARTDAAPEKKIDDTVWKVPVGRDDPAKGSTNAVVTLVVFSDFECPFCRHGARTLDRVLREYPDDTRVVWKDLPLPMHSQAEPAAELARAARARSGDDGFWKAHDLLYELQESLSEPTYQEIAGKLGLPWASTRAAMKAARYGALIQAGVALSDRVDVPATPTTFVNGRMVVGAQPYDLVKTVVDEELAKANQMVQKGIARTQVYGKIIEAGKQISPPTDAPQAPLPPP